MRQIDGTRLMEQNKRRGWENCILAFVVMGASALLMVFLFDFYFDMNDDTMMRDIMSGVYSGTPDGHNMQTLYPLGALIALCYRISGSLPWYGAFLFLCQFGCFFLVGVRLCTLTDVFFAKKRKTADGGGAEGNGAHRYFAGKLLCLSTVVFFQWGIWLTHMINIQYTITCGMLVGAAVFLFLTMPARVSLGEESGELPVKTFLIGSLPPMLLFLLAFHLRSEMALLTLPFLGLAGLFCWWEERPVFKKENLCKYGGLALLLLACMGLSMGADSLAYSGEWREFRQFFNDRTTIYDFYPEVLEGDISDAALEEMGVSPGAQLLLANYNFGLDDSIDGQMLSDVSVYAREHIGGGRDWGAVFREKLSLYRYRSFHGGDAPYNLLVFLGYGANIIAIVILMRGTICDLIAAAIQLFMVGLVRSGLWMFILVRGRDPVRITHPLYLVEFSLLAGMFLGHIWLAASAGGKIVRRTAEVMSENGMSAPNVAAYANRRGGFAQAQIFLSGVAAALLLLSVWGLRREVPAVWDDQIRRRETNGDWEEIDAYCRARTDLFFFEDVYSTVAFSGKLLERRENALANYDIAGGWMCKSLLYREKLAAFGIESAADGLSEGKAYFIMSDEEESRRGLTWLAVPYAEHGLDVQIAPYDRIGDNYGVYQIIPVSASGQPLRETARQQ